MQAEHVVAASACRVFLVEDHPLFRKGVADLLRAEKDFTIAGEADSAPVALAALREIPADLVVLDISLRGADGLELIKSLRAEHPDILILVLSMHDEEIYALRALRAGAHGYITKLEAGDSIVAAVRQIRAGRFYLSTHFSKTLVHRAVELKGKEQADPFSKISDRELEVLRLVGEGRSTREIAQYLNLSKKTIESHRLHLRDKLELKSAAELIRFALDWHGGKMPPFQPMDASSAAAPVMIG